MRACSGVWIAHGSGSADREVADEHGRVRVPPGRAVVHVAPRLAERERGTRLLLRLRQRGPVAAVPPRAHAADISGRRLGALPHRQSRASPMQCAKRSKATTRSCSCRIITSRSRRKMIRERLPRALVLAFWHIPWPNTERFGICPWHRELLEGLLGASILGFHTQLHCNNFFDAVDAYLEARIDRERNAVDRRERAERSSVPIRSRSSGRFGGCRSVPSSCRMQAQRALRARACAEDALARGRRRSTGLHEGHRGTTAGGRAPAGEVPAAAWPILRSCSWRRRAGRRSPATAI